MITLDTEQIKAVLHWADEYSTMYEMSDTDDQAVDVLQHALEDQKALEEFDVSDCESCKL